MEWLEDHTDEDTIYDPEFPKSFASDVSSHIKEIIHDELSSVASLWAQMGLSKSRRDTRTREIIEFVEYHVKKIKEMEEKSLNDLIAFKDHKIPEINKILSDLSLPLYEVPNMPLMSLCQLLRQKSSELLKIKEERMERLTKLKSQRAELCSQLATVPPALNMRTDIPSEEELMHLATYVSDLQKEREKRSKKFNLIARNIKGLMDDLERTSSNEFEKQLIEDQSKMTLSEENLRKAQALHAELENQYAKNNQRRKEMDKKLVNLWERLETPHAEQALFQTRHEGCKPSVLEKIDAEIARLDEIKRQNLGLYIQKIRPEIIQWYSKCYISEDEQKRFMPYIESESFNDDLLEIHETELERLKKFFEQNEPAFKKLESWMEKWERFQELESRKDDPDRFKNRGGALLKEEKEMKALQKDLPKMEKEVAATAHAWNETNPTHKFTIMGMDIKEYFTSQWQYYDLQKDNIKKERQMAKQRDLEANKYRKPVAGGGGVVPRRTPTKRPCPPAGPMGSSSKRGRIALSPSKIMNHAAPSRPAIMASKRNLAGLMGSQDSLASSSHKNMLEIDTEEEFQAQLAAHAQFQSTFIAGPEGGMGAGGVTKRPIVKNGADSGMSKATRRRSRSCTDLARGLNAIDIRERGRSPGSTPQRTVSAGLTPRFKANTRRLPFKP